LRREMREVVWGLLEINFVSPGFGCGEVELKMIFLGDSADVSIFAGADERKEIVRLNGETLLFEHGDGRGVDERFRIGQDAVHVEDDSADAGSLRFCSRPTHEWERDKRDRQPIKAQCKTMSGRFKHGRNLREQICPASSN